MAKTKYSLLLKYYKDLTEQRLKQIQFLLVENYQLKKELDMARELVEMKLQAGLLPAFKVDTDKLSTPNSKYPIH